jgi:hypothetical protein
MIRIRAGLPLAVRLMLAGVIPVVGFVVLARRAASVPSARS